LSKLWSDILIKWHTSFSFFAGKDYHGPAAVITRSVGKQMNKDKPVIQENEQSALDDKTTFNDGPISSGNSIFCSFYCFFVLLIQ